MRILVTGATGMIGCHAVAALVGAGHEVRLLVRNPDRVGRALDPLGVHAPDQVIGDVTDRDAVDRAVSGCDALIHSAGVFTLDRRREDEMMRVNVEGTETVIGTALRAGLDPIVHVSSVTALFPPHGDSLKPDESVKDPMDPYARSKADGERVARRYQEAGGPVVCVYPGSVWGPCDPTLADSIAVIVMFIKMGFIPVAPGGIPIVDVRDLASLLLATLEPGRGPRRYMAGGSFLNNAELTDILNELTGRKLRKLHFSGGLFRGIGSFGDALRRKVGFDIGLTEEAAITLTRGVPCDDSRAVEEFGVRFRPVAETLGDTLSWMYAEGKLSRRHVGDLAR
jgi:dihydroflavonol-4-reductase